MKTKSKTVVVFISEDGTEFLDELECKAHEDARLDKEFNDLLEAGEGTAYYVDDIDTTGLLTFDKFREFVSENRDWVLVNCMDTEPGDLR